MMKGGTVMANRKMYVVAMTILQTMIDVFPKDHLDFMFAGFLDPGDVVEMVMLGMSFYWKGI